MQHHRLCFNDVLLLLEWVHDCTPVAGAPFKHNANPEKESNCWNWRAKQSVWPNRYKILLSGSWWKRSQYTEQVQYLWFVNRTVWGDWSWHQVVAHNLNSVYFHVVSSHPALTGLWFGGQFPLPLLLHHFVKLHSGFGILHRRVALLPSLRTQDRTSLETFLYHDNMNTLNIFTTLQGWLQAEFWLLTALWLTWISYTVFLYLSISHDLNCTSLFFSLLSFVCKSYCICIALLQ